MKEFKRYLFDLVGQQTDFFQIIIINHKLTPDCNCIGFNMIVIMCDKKAVILINNHNNLHLRVKYTV